MNDPMEFPIYSTDDLISDDEIDKYKNRMLVSNCCASFSMSPTRKRLWDYYTNGFKGIVISYEYVEIENHLKRIK